MVGLSLSSCQILELILGKDDDTPPVVAITSPQTGQTVSGLVTVVATATDDTGIFRVVFYADDLSFAEDRTSPYEVSWNTAAVPAGTHYLKAVAYDTSGNSADSVVVAVSVQSTGGGYTEDFDGYPVGPTGSLSINMPADAGWLGLTLGAASLSIVGSPAVGVAAPALRLAHGAEEDDVATFFAQVPGMSKGVVELKVWLEDVHPGALCLSLGKGSLLLGNTATAFFLWLVDRGNGLGSSTAWFNSPTTVAFGDEEVTKSTAHTLRIVFDTASGGTWGAWLDGNPLVYSTPFAQPVDSIDYLSISTMGLSSDWYGGAFVVDDICTWVDPLAVIPEDPGGGDPGDPTAPVAPSGLSVVMAGSSVLLSWIDESDNEDGFFILRGTTPVYAGASWEGVALVPPGSTSWVDDDVAPGETWYYLVVSYVEDGDDTLFGMPPASVGLTIPQPGGVSSWPPDGVYVAGGYIPATGGFSRAAIWHDDGATITCIDLTDGTASAARALDVVVTDDGIHACGFIHQPGTTVQTAAYWQVAEDGSVSTTILGSGTYNVSANALSVGMDGTVYIVGSDWNVVGIAGVLWTDGVKTFVTSSTTQNWASLNEIISVGSYQLIAGTYDDNYNHLNHAQYWIPGLGKVDLAGASGNAGYGYDIAYTGDGAYVVGMYNISGVLRGTFWLDDGSVVTRTTFVPVASYTTGIAVESGTVYVAGYRADGQAWVASLWKGGTGGMVEQILPVAAGSGNSYAGDVEVSGGTAWVLGSWKNGLGLQEAGYWTVSTTATGRRPLGRMDEVLSLEKLTIRNPVPDFSIPPESEPDWLPAYPDGVSPSGLVAYYPFSGSASDRSGTGNHGTASGGPVYVSDRFGNPSAALSFDGSDDYVLVPDSASLDLATEWTLSAWLYLPSLEMDQEYRIFYKSRYDGTVSPPTFGGGYSMMLANYEGPLTCFYHNVYGEYTNYLSVEDFSAGSWHHLCVTGHTSAGRVWGYLDGVCVADSYMSYSSLIANNYGLYIGRGNYASGDQEYLAGTLDDLRIFNRAFSDTEVLALYQEGGWGY
jgi:hypothetical protein